MTLRGHKGPLMSITGPEQNNESPNANRLLFTAGVEGDIRVWNIPEN